MGLCDLLTHQNADPIILNKLPALFSTLIGYLKYVQHIELKGMQNSKKKELAYDSDSDEEGQRLSNKDVLRIFLDDNSTTLPVINANDSDSDDDEEDSDEDDDDYDDDDDLLFSTDKVTLKIFITSFNPSHHRMKLIIMPHILFLILNNKMSLRF